MAAIEARLTALEGRVAALEARVAALVSEVAQVKWVIGFMAALQVAILVKLFVHG